jgi:hypothetical protein
VPGNGRIRGSQVATRQRPGAGSESGPIASALDRVGRVSLYIRMYDEQSALCTPRVKCSREKSKTRLFATSKSLEDGS